MNIISKLQPHTVSIYNLQDKRCTIEQVPARQLLLSLKFDVFAKLYYITHREKDFEGALKLYIEHIKAFNPDGKEPGREDKTTLKDFVTSFDALIETIRTKGFDKEVSLIPIDRDGVSLDGSHRIAAAAFFNEDVVVAKFPEVQRKCEFDYSYFIRRGLRREYADAIMFEMLNWKNNIYVACLWPKLAGKKKEEAKTQIRAFGKVCYVKSESINLKSMFGLVASVYKSQPWTADKEAVKDKATKCYGASRKVEFVFFESDLSLEEILKEKEKLRTLFSLEKHSLHITDNIEETKDIAALIFNTEQRKSWDTSYNFFGKTKNYISEQVYIFKHVRWLNFKVFVAKIIGKLLSRPKN